MRTRRIAAALGAALLVGTIPAPATADPTVTPLNWHSCSTGPGDEIGAALDAAGARCAELTVPLDYSRPRGRTIDIAVSRLPATDPAARRGALALNPGGPGDPALDLVLELAEISPEVAARYDLIGMDPRFVGRSSPLSCDWETGLSMRGAGPTWQTFAEGATRARELAAGCVEGNEALLPHATTRNTARDLDRVRAALGEPKLSYVGWSGGSYLGAVYTQMFPERVDRFVLDSAVDPEVYGPRVTRAMGEATEAALRNWACWAAERDATYHLGTTRDAVLATVERVRRAAEERLLRVGDHLVDARLLPVLLFLPIRFDTEEDLAGIAADVRVLADAADGRRVTPTPGLETHLRMATTPNGIGDGTLFLCADRAAPRDPETYYRDIRAHRSSEPLFGPLTRNITPCAFWPTAPVEAPTRIDNAVPALIVGASGDPRTPRAGQLAMHQALSGSRMITLDDAHRHLVYGVEGNPCVDGAVNRYLLDGVLPAADLTCTRVSAAGS
ncbi:alpha/beta hydrolase [Phytomonospora sp. NPDC050363]|uniref:alpha/beta hydrolase n=1 Tax=Phytomonospora sp. NPDC050363 TaxID=3155642 RepID=UPI0033CC4E80